MSLFITFEGPDGAGKSTQASLLHRHLEERGYSVVLTREPGGTRIGEQIRTLLVGLQYTEVEATTEVLLFSAARAQIVREVIRPHLAQGIIVICDRYADSTYAYQGYGQGWDLTQLEAITNIATDSLLPDMTIYLAIPAEDGLERKMTRLQEWNRFDARDVAFHQRVSEGFDALLQQEPHRWSRFDARQPIDNLAQRILTAVEERLAAAAILPTQPDQPDQLAQPAQPTQPTEIPSPEQQNVAKS